MIEEKYLFHKIGPTCLPACRQAWREAASAKQGGTLRLNAIRFSTIGFGPYTTLKMQKKSRRDVPIVEADNRKQKKSRRDGLVMANN